MKVDSLAFRKISKHHFLRDIEKSFQEVTLMDPEPQHFFLFKNVRQRKIEHMWYGIFFLTKCDENQ